MLRLAAVGMPGGVKPLLRYALKEEEELERLLARVETLSDGKLATERLQSGSWAKAQGAQVS